MLLLALVGAIGLASAPGHAQVPAGNVSQRNTFNVPAGSLTQALSQFAGQAGINLSFSPELTAELRSNGLQGPYTIEQGFAELLRGTGLEAVPIGGGEYTLRMRQVAGQVAPLADADTDTLPEVAISATLDSPQAIESATQYTVSQSSSAAKLDLALKETPQSISVFTEKLIQDMNLTSIDAVLSAAPGVTAIENGVPGAGRVEYYSRGFAINSFQIDGLMTDGAAFGAQNNQSNRTAVGLQDAFLYERIDIIRGSTGLTTGQGDPSASLSFVRKKPLFERQILANLQYGSWGNKRAELDFSSPLNESGTWRGRIAATGDHGNAYIDRVKHRGTALYAITELDATPFTRLTLGASQIKRRIDGAGPHGIRRTTNIRNPNTELGRSFNNATRWSYRDFDYRNIFASINHTFANDWQIVGAYNRFDSKSDRLFGVMGSQWYYPQWDVASYLWGRERYDNATNAFDVYLKGDFELLGRQHDFVIGANQTRSDRTNYNYLPVTSDPIRPNSQAQVDDPNHIMWRSERWIRPSLWNDGNIGLPALDLPNWKLTGVNASWDTPYRISNFKQVQKGIYGSVRLRPLERLQVILGARYGKGERFVSQPTTLQPYGGLIYELTPSVNAYVGYARVEKPNAFEMDYAVDANGNWLKPLKADTIEAGFKGGFFDNRLNLAATYFTMTQDNYPIETNRYVEYPRDSGVYVPEYVGLNGYRVYGVELNAAGQITPHWQIMAGYVHQRQKMPTDFWGIETGEDFEAQFFFPKNSFKVFTSYDFGSSRQFTIGGGAYWQSAGRNNIQYIGDDGGRYYWWQGSYALYNLMARWRIDKNITVGVNVRNLFDKKYFTNSSAGNYGMPRSVTASVNMKF